MTHKNFNIWKEILLILTIFVSCAMGMDMAWNLKYVQQAFASEEWFDRNRDNRGLLAFNYSPDKSFTSLKEAKKNSITHLKGVIKYHAIVWPIIIGTLFLINKNYNPQIEPIVVIKKTKRRKNKN